MTRKRASKKLHLLTWFGGLWCKALDPEDLPEGEGYTDLEGMETCKDCRRRYRKNHAEEVQASKA